MWRARPLSDTAPPKAVPLTHGEARGSVTWTNAVDDEENERRPPETAAAPTTSASPRRRSRCRPPQSCRGRRPRTAARRSPSTATPPRSARASRPSAARTVGWCTRTTTGPSTSRPPRRGPTPTRRSSVARPTPRRRGAAASLAKHTKKARVAMVAPAVTPATRQRLKGAGATRVVEVEKIENPADRESDAVDEAAGLGLGRIREDRVSGRGLPRRRERGPTVRDVPRRRVQRGAGALPAGHLRRRRPRPDALNSNARGHAQARAEDALK